MQASPSKARAQALETHSWSLITSWLSKLYHPAPIPSFERNTATLQALQALIAENAAADKLRELVYDAQREELQESRVRTTVVAPVDQNEAGGADTGELLQVVESSLSDVASLALDSLARSAVLLACEKTSSTIGSIDRDLRSRILSLSQEIFTLESQIRSLDEQISRLQRSQQGSAQQQQSQNQPDHDHRSNPLDPDDPEIDCEISTTIPDTSTLHAQTLQNQRETKQLSLKAQEYRERVAQLSRQLTQLSQANPQRSSLTMSTVAAKQTHLDKCREEIQKLESTIRAFHGLPPDVQASREEVRRATVELERLRARRDELFERLGSGDGAVLSQVVECDVTYMSR